MLPTFKQGNEVLIDERAYQDALPQIGEVVVAEHPHRPKFWLIKRVTHIRPDGSCYLVGDNPNESTDSRAYGWFKRTQLLGKVTSYL